MSLSARDLFDTPDHYLMTYEGEQAIFVGMDRAAYGRSIFLDARIQAARAGRIAVPAAAMAGYGDTLALPSTTGWIFHTAHCGSTLLARALDRADTLVLREPMALRQMGIDPAVGTPDWSARLRLTARMLSRRYRPDAPVIVKANVPVNFILPQLMALDPQAPAILLYYPLRTYLLAILRSPDHRRWVNSVTGEMASAIEALAGPIAGLDDAERAAALWLAQMRIYADALAAFPNTRSLDAETLFDQPQSVLAAAFSLYGVSVSAFDIDAIVASDLFATYAKNPGVKFDNSVRRARQAALSQTLAGDVDRAVAWVEARAARYPVVTRLAKPLTGQAPLLLA